MSKNKSKIKVNSRELVLPVVLAVVTLAGVVWLARNNNQPSVSVEVSPSPSPVVEVEEEIKDGVYTNYTYGFRVELPELTELRPIAVNDYILFSKTFVNDTENLIIRLNLLNGELIKLRHELNQFSYSHESTLYFSLINRENGYTFKDQFGTTQGEVLQSSSEKNFVSYKFEVPSTDGSKGGYFYVADWLYEDNVFQIKLTTSDTANLSKLESIFDTLVNSFKRI